MGFVEGGEVVRDRQRFPSAAHLYILALAIAFTLGVMAANPAVPEAALVVVGLLAGFTQRRIWRLISEPGA